MARSGGLHQVDPPSDVPEPSWCSGVRDLLQNDQVPRCWRWECHGNMGKLYEILRILGMMLDSNSQKDRKGFISCVMSYPPLLSLSDNEVCSILMEMLIKNKMIYHLNLGHPVFKQIHIDPYSNPSNR